MVIIEESKILDLFWARDEAAIIQSKQKYGRSLHKVAYNILYSNHDAEECVSDTMHKAWEAIPPSRPQYLWAYLTRITRNLSYKRWRASTAAKRGGSQPDLMLSELSQSIPQTGTVESVHGAFDYNQTVATINLFLRGLDAPARIIFVRRYFYGDSINDICRNFSISESKAKSMLFRTRNKLRMVLEKEGVVL